MHSQACSHPAGLTIIPFSCCSWDGDAGNNLSSSFISSCFPFKSRSSLSLRVAPFRTRPVVLRWLRGICGVDSCSCTFLHISSLKNEEMEPESERGGSSSTPSPRPASALSLCYIPSSFNLSYKVQHCTGDVRLRWAHPQYQGPPPLVSSGMSIPTFLGTQT